MSTTERRGDPATGHPDPRALRYLFGDPAPFSRHILRRPLRPYQLAIARAVVAAVGQGRQIVVEIARQGGKNETSAHIETFLLNRYQSTGGQIVKAAPTFKPQLINSLLRLKRLLANPLNADRWAPEFGYIVRLGLARCLFFSAEPSANVVGATADLLLEFDEAQDIPIDKHDKDFLPMGATGNASRVYWGTPWHESTLLALAKRAALDAQARDGVPRVFRFPWFVVAEYLPAYGAYVQAERDRLGERHPLFRTQYELDEIAGAGSLFGPEQLAHLTGNHLPEIAGADGPYVAGLDVAGARLDPATGQSTDRDLTALAIARVTHHDPLTPSPFPPRVGERAGIGGTPQVGERAGIGGTPQVGESAGIGGTPQVGESAGIGGTPPEEPETLLPHLALVALYQWSDIHHSALFPRIVDLLRHVWHVDRVSVDCTGVGAGLADLLLAALGDTVQPVQFTAARKSALGYALLAATNAGRLKLYRHGPDDAPATELRHQLAHARFEALPNQQLRWAVPDPNGHDDLLIALALALDAAGHAAPPLAASTLTAPDPDAVTTPEENPYR